MPHYGREYIHTSIHDFKSNIAKYIRILHSSDYKGVVVKRYNEPVGLFVPMDGPKKKRETARAATRSHIDDFIAILKE